MMGLSRRYLPTSRYSIYALQFFAKAKFLISQLRSPLAGMCHCTFDDEVVWAMSRDKALCVYALLVIASNRKKIQLNGFNVDIPQPSKSLIFLVTSVKECILAVAAINISACVRGLP